MSCLIVGGTFNEEGGKSSKIVSEMAKNLSWNVVNGGSLKVLHSIKFEQYKTVLWMPNLNNDLEKMLPEIKKRHETLTLISSKRVVEQDYTQADIIGRLLKTKSNLGIMITQDEALIYKFQLLDPLGNHWITTTSIPELCQAIKSRLSTLSSLTRWRSHQVQENIPVEIEEKFLEVIKQYGNEFSKHVNAFNPNRLLGNASTRCAKGFPAQRQGEYIAVSKRNVDKETISSEDFVAVKEGHLDENSNNGILYYNDQKPSVDTAIQLRAFGFYKNVNYMLHGHVYVEDAPFTLHKIPCGYVEEFEEIKSLFPDENASNFTVNLKGHGCIIMAQDLEYFSTLKLISRTFPED
jgi:hypothetical protein